MYFPMMFFVTMEQKIVHEYTYNNVQMLRTHLFSGYNTPCKFYAYNTVDKKTTFS